MASACEGESGTDQAEHEQSEMVVSCLHSQSHSQLDVQSEEGKGGDSLQANVPNNKEPDKSGSVSQMSKRAQKKLIRKEKLKELRKAKRAPNFTKNSNPGFSSDIFGETEYYFENGLRKVYPYPYTFSTYAKERWFGRTIQDIFEHEFRVDSPDNFRTSVSKGYMRVNGKVIGLDYALQNGDLIEHHIHRHENPVSGTPIEILEDTEDVVVINKPASIPCHPCGKFRFNSIVFIMGKEYGYANLRNIYRLDRLTSGVLIMGKTARKTKELENQVLHRHVHKEYVARVVGEFPLHEITVDRPLDCLSHKLTLWRVVEKGGKPSRTTFQRLSYNGRTSLVKCIPHTGRTHQIRVHLQYLGHPIVNDPYYNSPSWGPLRGKGGHCDVSHEELCQRIMQEHNVGLWCEGENPLYTQRISATETAKQQSPQNTKSETAKEIISIGVEIPTTDAPEEQCGDTAALSKNDIWDDMSDDAAFTPKRPRLDCDVCINDDSGDQKVSVSDAQGAMLMDSTIHTFSDAITEQVDSESCGRATICPTSSVENANSTASVAVNTSDAAVLTAQKSIATEEEKRSPVQGLEHTPGQNEANCVKEGNERKVERKEFDPERWVPDPLCESCRLKYIDPKPTDLLLYLHALRYKGPTWDYMTKLPDWAAEDWEEPEEYKKYLP